MADMVSIQERADWSRGDARCMECGKTAPRRSPGDCDDCGAETAWTTPEWWMHRYRTAKRRFVGVGALAMILLAVNVTAFALSRGWPLWIIPAAVGAVAVGYFGVGGLWLRGQYQGRHVRYFGRGMSGGK